MVTTLWHRIHILAKSLQNSIARALKYQFHEIGQWFSFLAWDLHFGPDYIK